MTDSATAATHEVRLALYDLSQGMARSLSGQFLGPAHSIDIIPHTALVVYGREYYFGGGIQSCEPHEFRRQRGIFPIEVTSLGRTTVSQREFEDWCVARTLDGSFAPGSYDLMRRNCNNFSHEAATGGLQLDRGVPDWILGVPERFLSSPMGQMIRPMLEGMQMSGPGAMDGGVTLGRTATPPSVPLATAASASENPWANVPTSSSAETKPPSSEAVRTTDEVKTPILDKYSRPLLSADTATVSICTSKICKSLVEEEKSSIEALGEVLSVPGRALTHKVLESSLPVLMRCLDPPSKNAAFALMLLRLVALRPPADTGAALELKECVVLVGAKLVECHSSPPSNSTNRPLTSSHAARSMAWCCLGNAAAADSTSEFLLRDDPALRDGLVDAALSDASPESQPRREVRQSAVTYLYNVAHGTVAIGGAQRSDAEGDEELPDLYVTLLCGALEGLTDEVDPTVMLRRLLITGKILRSGKDGTVNESVKSLVADLGFGDTICSLSRGSTENSEDSKSVAKIADELSNLLSISGKD